MKYLITTIAAVVLVGCGPNMSIHDAAELGNIKVVKRHISAGVDVNDIKPEEELDEDEGGEKTALHYAAENGHDEIVELLIASGADINAKDGEERTPLHFAAEEGESDVAAELMRLGADVNARDIIGRTPLDFANKLPYLLRKRGAYTGEELKAEGK